VETLISRLQQRFEKYNAQKLVPYKLSISIGVAQLGADGAQSMEDLMAQADNDMYENKRAKQQDFGRPTAVTRTVVAA
jgi:GGDEF domain-containing protein